MKNLLIPILLLLLFSCKTKLQSEMEKIGETPEETKKSITTKYYKPVYQNGEWICGNEELNWDKNFRPNTVYLDEFGNALLTIEKSEKSDQKGLLGTTYKRNIYFSPKNKDLSIVYVKSLSDKGYIEGFREFIRDNKGLLIETKNHINNDYNYLLERPQQIKYDKDGNLTEVIDGTTKSFIKKSPPSKNLVVKTIQVIDDSVKYDYNSIHGLIKQITEIYEYDILKRVITEEYKFGYLKSHEDIVKMYDDKKRVIREEMNGKCIAGDFTHPFGLNQKELDDYDIEHYYSKQEYKDDAYIFEWNYNKKGDIESYIERDMGNDGKLHLSILSIRYEYVYNSKGDWIKRIIFPILDNDPYNNIFTYNKVKNVPKLIGIREIKYY